MNPEVRKMLDSMYDLLTARFHDAYKAWDHLVEFLAVDNCGNMLLQMDHKFEWLFEDQGLARKLMDTYDPKLLRTDTYDHLGDIYLEKVVSPSQIEKQGQYLTPINVAEMTAQTTIGETQAPVKVLDPCVGTGRLLMAAHKVAPNAKLFGVDNDLRMVRIAFTNLAIHDISGYLLHADSLKHETDISADEGLHNWRYANRWDSCMDKLKPIKSPKNGRGPPKSKGEGQLTIFPK